MLRGLAILLLLGTSVYAVIGMEDYISQAPAGRPDDRQSASARDDETLSAYGPRTVVLEADHRGHFLVTASINGRSIDMIADTGASALALKASDAKRIGIEPRTLTYDIPVQTANGKVMVAGVVLDRVEVSGISLDNVRAMVASDDALSSSLLGMSFLGRLASVKMSGKTLELVE